MRTMMKELLAKRAEHVKTYKAIAEHAGTRELTPEEAQQLADLDAQVKAIDSRLKVLEDAEALEEQTPPPGEEEASSRGRRRSTGILGDDLPDTDGPHPYALMKVIRHLAGYAPLDGIEAEIHQELARRSDKTSGVRVPWNLSTHRHLGGAGNLEIRNRRNRELRTPAGTIATVDAAGSIAAILGTDFIDLLRNKMKVVDLGATVMSNMEGGTFALPKQTAAGTVYWVTEGNAPTTSNQTIGQVVWTPKTCGAFTDLTRKFILQTSIDAEAFVKNDLTTIMAIEFDRVALHGSGAGAEPLGLAGMANVQSIALGANGVIPTYGNMVDMESKVAIANADLGSLAYLSNAQVRGKLKQTARLGSTTGLTIWQDGEVNGYRAEASQQCSSTLTKGTAVGICSAIFFGYWASLIYGMWGGMDVVEDPYTKSSSGGIRIVVLQDLDVQCRYQESFCRCLDALVA